MGAGVTLKAAAYLPLVRHLAWVRSSGREGRRLAGDELFMEGIDLRDMDLSETELPGARFTGCIMDGVDFYAAFLSGSRFLQCSLRAARFVKAQLDHSEFEDCDLEGASFFRASLYEGRFQRAGLQTADLRKAFTSGCRFDDGQPDGC